MAWRLTWAVGTICDLAIIASVSKIVARCLALIELEACCNVIEVWLRRGQLHSLDNHAASANFEVVGALELVLRQAQCRRFLRPVVVSVWSAKRATDGCALRADGAFISDMRAAFTSFLVSERLAYRGEISVVLLGVVLDLNHIRKQIGHTSLSAAVFELGALSFGEGCPQKLAGLHKQ